MISVREVMGLTLLGEANREAPVRTEPHPTRSFAPACAGSAMNKRQRVEWAPSINLHLIFRPMGLTLELYLLGHLGPRIGNSKLLRTHYEANHLYKPAIQTLG
jgi:hypothetical protein